MRKIIFSFIVLISFCLIISCSEQPTEIINQDGSNAILSKKPGGGKPGGGKPGGGKPSGVKYTSSVELTKNIITITPNYYDGKPVGCYDSHNYDYHNPPEGTDYITISVTAHSLNSKDGFNTVLVSIKEDFDKNGIPDDDGEFLLLGDNLDYYQIFTETPEPVILYWWGQWKDVDPDNPCYLKICEPGQYLLKVLLRKELKNKKGNFGVHQGVYSSVDDPYFQEYEGITQGYVPINVN